MAASWRTVRVFISSTFRDMHSERDHLVKRVLPELRERLLPYRIHLIDVDLRWGITEEEVNNDRVLDLCLQQIDECRPFFLGLLGERYGWVPKTFDERALSKYGWIQHITGKSVTELEILHGVLNRPDMRTHAFFYFRDPAFIGEVPPARRKDVLPEDEESALKLAALKDAIRGANLPTPPMESYPCRYAGLRVNWRLVSQQMDTNRRAALESIAQDGVVDLEEYASLDAELRSEVDGVSTVLLDGLDTFGERVLEDLWRAIKAECELSDALPVYKDDALAEEQDYHERFIESRTRVYIGRKSYQAQLRNVAHSDTPYPCFVTAAGGMGKSALLARFAASYASRYPDELVVPHFVGASPRSTSLRQMLERFCGILKQRFGFEEAIKLDVRELITQFQDFINQVGTNHTLARVVFVIDALNQMDDADNARRMHWLPREFPANVKIIASCIDNPGKKEPVLQAIKGRKAYRIVLEALTDEERFEIVTQVPSLSAKTLAPAQVQLLLDNPATRNPLFLLVALEELRGFGSYELLNARIATLPSGEDAVEGLFAQVLERLELEFDAGAARTLLSFLASARRGLSERELRELLSPNGSEISNLKSNELFPILRQLRPYLMHRGELLNFFHDGLRLATQHRYLDTTGARHAAHARLAEYFGKQPDYLPKGGIEESLDASQGQTPPAVTSTVSTVSTRSTAIPNRRRVDELPWQLLRAEQHDGLAAVLEDLFFLEAKIQAGWTFELAQDFTEAVGILPAEHSQRRRLILLRQALGRDINFIARHADDYPQALFQCLWNSCWWYDCAEAKKHYQEPEDGWRTSPPWGRAGPKLHEILEAWRVEMSRLRPNACWIGSLRPPAIHLGGALEAVLHGHSAEVQSVAFSPNDVYIASGSLDGSVRLWDARTGEELHLLKGHSDCVHSVCFSPDGHRIMTGSGDKTLRIWDVQTGTELLCITGHSARVTGTAFSPDGRRAASGSWDNTVRVWDVKTGAEEFALRGHEGFVDAVSYSSDGRLIASGSHDNTVRVWDAHQGKELRVLRGHEKYVSSVLFSQDRRRMATGSADKTIRLWDTERGLEIRTLRGHTGTVTSVCFSMDGRRVASSSMDTTVRVWDVNTGEQLLCLSGHSMAVWAVALSSDGRRAASGNGDATVRIWDLDADTTVRDLPDHASRVNALAFSPDGKRIVSGGEDTTVRVWLAESGEELLRLGGHTKAVNIVVFSPDGSRIAGGSTDMTVRLWDALSGSEVSCLRGHENGVRCVEFSLDGRRIISSAHDGTIRVWDTNSGAEIRRYESPDVWHIGFSPDNRRIVGASMDAKIRIWDVETGALLGCMEGHKSDVNCAGFSPEGCRIASGGDDGTVRVWDVRTGAEIVCLKGHTDYVWRVAFSSDGLHVVSESADDTLRVWDAETAQCLQTIRGVGCIAAVASGPSTYPFRMLRRGGETVIEDAVAGEAVAWFPDSLDTIAAHAPGLTWAGSVSNHSCLIHLETTRTPAIAEAVRPVVTPTRLWLFHCTDARGAQRSGRWDEKLSVLCPLCGERSVFADVKVVGRLTSCPSCSGTLEVSAFICDLSDKPEFFVSRK